MDAILQLVRPRRFKKSYFEVTANDQLVVLINERVCSLNKEEAYGNHPLVIMGRAIVQAEALGLGMRMLFKYIAQT